MQNPSRAGTRSVSIAFLIAVCSAPAAHAPASLQEAFKGDFVVGAAINEAQSLGRISAATS